MILLIARFPVPGQVKTRLIPALGPDGAARLHRRMTESVADAAHRASTDVAVCFTGAGRQQFRAWLGDGFTYVPQPAGDLGERLRAAFAAGFGRGAHRRIAVGCDIPGVTADLLRGALDALGDSDVVLGPAEDGGYYLIGTRRPHPGLFEGIDWGTADVCRQTLDAARHGGLKVHVLPTLADIDRPEDLAPLRGDPRFADCFTDGSLVSAIVPTLNEAGTLRRTIERLGGDPNVEILVADGGSLDDTLAIAGRTGVRVLRIDGGRAAQQNVAAGEARGRHLFFLHADTMPPEDYAAHIRRVLDDPSVVAGAFQFRTDAAGLPLRLVEWGANLRSTHLQWPYGDQGLFMEKRVFHELGGFADLPIMEDFDLVRRLRRRGRIAIVDAPAVTSSRRWRRLGVVRTTAINQLVIAGFMAGVSPRRLACFYRRMRPAAGDDRA